MNSRAIPEFAVLGHPNEGKSSVVSTLAEDDSVKVSPTPGETVRCRAFPVVIDGREIIRFIDTPGFQVPRKTLEWFKNFNGPADRIVQEFIKANQDNRIFSDECELLSPIARGAGIIFVADASRPVRSDDKAEMEILRLTGRPRMAIINSKDVHADFSDDWKNEFRQNFNTIRVFNAHNATYSERIALLESLKGIDQDWEPDLFKVISAFKLDWDSRNQKTAGLICDLLAKSLRHYVTGNISDESMEMKEREKLQEAYKEKIIFFEKNAYQKIRKLFKHNIFNVDLPGQSILLEDLFSEKTWKVLGLTQTQLIAAAAAAGSAAGVFLDVAAAGHTFGIFTALGGIVGAGSAMFKGREIAKTKVAGLPLGGYQIKVGPNRNIQFLYVLLDRALIFYFHIINWTHGRRDYPRNGSSVFSAGNEKQGFTSRFDGESKKICNAFFKEIGRNDDIKMESAKQELIRLIKDILDKNRFNH
ncbi:MAG: GTPase/DUF3482 domain-containing protein [Desulfobacterales bacterium]